MIERHHPWDPAASGGALEPLAPEKLAAIRKIRRLMDFWHIRLDELAGPLPQVARSAPAVPTPRTHYRHPVHGATWNGVGYQPEWLKEALLKEGYTVDQLRLPALATCAPEIDTGEPGNIP